MRLTGWILLFSVVITCVPRRAWGQTNEEPFEQFQWTAATPGARGNAMGGTVVAVVDDATATLTNPAALLALVRPDASVDFRTATLRVPRLSAVDSLLTGVPTTLSETAHALPLVDVAIPLPGHKVALGLARHEFLTYQSSFHLSPRILPGVAARGPSPVDSHVDFRAVRYATSVAVALHQRLQLGATVSADRLRADMLNTRHDVAGGLRASDITETAIVTNESRIDDVDTAVGVIVGARYQPAAMVSLGIAFSNGRSFKVHEDFVPNAVRVTNRPDQAVEEGFAATVSVNVPRQLTGGVALRPRPWLLLGVDVARVAYSALEKDLTPIIAHDLVTAGDFAIRDATELHAGVEFTGGKRNPVFLRAGLFSDHDHSLRYTGNVQPRGAVTAEQALRINVYEGSVFDLGTHHTHVIGTFGGGVAIGGRLQVDAAYVWKQQFILSTGVRF